MKRVGNGKAAETYEAGLPENFRRPTENETYALEQFIREKYERKLYFKKPTTSSSSKSSSSSNKPSSTPQKSTSKPNVQPTKPLITEELIQWETSDTTSTSNTNNNGFGFEGFTAFTGANVIGDDVEFSGFQSASSSASNILHSPRQNTNSNFDAESAFFSGVTSTTATTNVNNNTNNNVNNNAPKPGKDAILQLYNQPISGGISTGNNNMSGMGMNKQPVTQANYNVRVPSLGLGTGGVATPNVPYNNNNNMNGVPPMMYSNNGMMNQPVMYGNVTPPGYVNPVAANMMMNMNSNMNPNMNINNMNMNSSNYVNPNYLKMMNGGVNSSSNSMNMNMNMSNKPLF